LDARQSLVDVHGVEQRLVETSLVFVRDREQLELLGVDLLGHERFNGGAKVRRNSLEKLLSRPSAFDLRVFG
jgi:hypothetical protein